jgi:general secretion pathway protein K
MRPLIKDKEGVVLILVLAVCALFYILIANFKTDQGMDRALAYNFKGSIQTQYLGSAGVEAAMSILAEDDNEYDSDDEDWAKFPQFMMVASGSLEDMIIEGNITDECSKLDINSLVELSGDKYVKNEFRAAQLEKLMVVVLKIDILPQEAEDLINNICDWIDMDNEPQPKGGAEDEYYKTLDEPYDCKDGPMDSPEEILLVKGMKKEWFYGTEDYKGIGQFITAGTGSMGKGVVNVNTASKEVLESLAPGIDESVVEKIIGCRPFKKINEVLGCIEDYNNLVSDPINDPAKLQAMLDVKSNMFSVDIKGTIKSTGATVNTKAKLFMIDNGAPQIVYYKIY